METVREPVLCERCEAKVYVPRVFTPILCESCHRLGGIYGS